MSKQSESVGMTPVLVDDLIEDLVWPKLLKAAGLALAPQRVGLAFFTVILLALLLSAANGLTYSKNAETGEESSFLRTYSRELGSVRFGAAPVTDDDAALAQFGAMLQGETMPARTWSERVARVARALHRTFIGLPTALLREHPLATLLLAPLMLLVKVIGGGAVARSAAVDYGLGETRPWPRVLGFAVGRWLSLVGAAVGPLALVWAVALGLAVAGWALFNVPVLNIIGGILYGLLLLGALVAGIIMIAYALGAVMLVPAVMTEGTDGFDAVSRVYEFVFNRPLRLVLYLIVVIVQGVVAIFVAAVLAWLVLLVANEATGAWAGDAGRSLLLGHAADDAGFTWKASAWFAGLWIAIPIALVAAYAFSYVQCAGTMLYLALRRINDGQDMREVWVPGMVEGTMAEALAAKTADEPA